MTDLKRISRGSATTASTDHSSSTADIALNKSPSSDTAAAMASVATAESRVSYGDMPELKYYVSEGAVQSLKESRKSLKASDHSRRSSTSSGWRGLWNRGQRLYGSIVSVASSVTITEFGNDYSEEGFDGSEDYGDECSLDVSQLGVSDQAHAPGDMRPTQPQRQESVSVFQNSKSNSNRTGLVSTSDHTRQLSTSLEEDSEAMSGGPPLARCKSADQTPNLPNRKTSWTNSWRNSNRSLAEESGANINPQSKAAAAPFKSAPSNDVSPQNIMPRRKHSSHTSQLESNMNELLEQAYAFFELIELKQFVDDQGESYSSTFVGSETVDRMVETSLAATREEAVRMGQQLQHELELFFSVSAEDVPFLDTEVVYHWIDDNLLDNSDHQQEVLELQAPLPRISMCRNHSNASSSNSKNSNNNNRSKKDRPPMHSVRRATDTSISIEENSSLRSENAKRLSVPKVGGIHQNNNNDGSNSDLSTESY